MRRNMTEAATQNNDWKYFLVVFAIIFAALLFTSAWNNAAQKNYEASLSPQERQNIIDKATEKAQQEADASAKSWDEFFNKPLYSQFFMFIFIGMGMILILLLKSNFFRWDY
jgi:uncharacterized membrane protein